MNVSITKMEYVRHWLKFINNNDYGCSTFSVFTLKKNIQDFIQSMDEFLSDCSRCGDYIEDTFVFNDFWKVCVSYNNSKNIFTCKIDAHHSTYEWETSLLDFEIRLRALKNSCSELFEGNDEPIN